MSDPGLETEHATGAKPTQLRTDDVQLYYTDEDAQKRLSQQVRQQLRKLIRQKGVTLEQVAAALKIPNANKSTISHLLNGRTKLGLYQVVDLCSVLGVDIGKLLRGAEEPGTAAEQDTVMQNFNWAWEYISTELGLDDVDDIRSLATDATKNLGTAKASEEEIKREINRVLVARYKATSAKQ